MAFGLLGGRPPSGLLGGLHQGIASNSNMMMGLGLGIMGGGGMAAAAPLALRGSQMDTEKKEAARALAQESQDKNLTAQYMVRKGLVPDYDSAVQVIAAGAAPEIIKGAFQKKEAATTANITEWNAAGRPGTLQEWIQGSKGGADDGGYFGTPIYGSDADGNPIVGLPGKDGSFKRLDMGGAAPTPKDPFDVARMRKEGEAMGTSAAALPGALANVDAMLDTIKDLETDPNRSRATGMTSMGNAIPATGGYDYQQKVNQAKGQVFLQAYEALRGASAITDVEGKKAEDAKARLDTAQSEEAFLKALSDLKAVVEQGRKVLISKAGGVASLTSSPTSGISIRKISP